MSAIPSPRKMSALSDVAERWSFELKCGDDLYNSNARWLFGLMTLCGSYYAYLIPWNWNVAREMSDERIWFDYTSDSYCPYLVPCNSNVARQMLDERSFSLMTGPYYAYLIQWSWSVAWEMLDELSFSLMTLCLSSCRRIFKTMLLKCDHENYSWMILCGSYYAFVGR